MDFEITDSGAAMLAEAIIELAVRDYLRTYKCNCPGSTKMEEKREDLERGFFKKNWFSVLMMSDINPEKVIDTLKKRGDYVHWKYVHKCYECSRASCPHKINARNFLMEKFCEKEKERGI